MIPRLKDTGRRILYGRPRRVVLQNDPSIQQAWTQVTSADIRKNERPTILGRSFEFPIDKIIPPLGVFCFEDGRSTAYRGWTYDRAGSLVAETTWFGTKKVHDIDLSPSFARPLKVTGTCLSLLSEYGDRNYGHYILDCLSRVGIAERAGWSAAQIDHYYVYRPLSPSAKLLLKQLGIDEEKCIYANDVRALTADRMLVTIFPGTGENYAPVVPETLSRPWLTVPCKGRRLYIPRRGTRRLTNEHIIETIAVDFGFEVFDPGGCIDDFSYFREAEIVVGPHGAGLSNIAVCRPGTKVLELTPSDHILPYFCTLADAAGLNFYAMLGTSVGHRPQGATGPSPYDFYVDPTVFASALETIMSM